MLSKQTIRQQQLKKLAQPYIQAKQFQAEQLLYQKLLQHPAWQQAQVVALTISKGCEIDTKPLIMQALLQGKEVVVPVTKAQGKMDFVSYHPEMDLQVTKYGILEPTTTQVKNKSQIDLIIVPGMAFFANQKRIGFGGGFYDRYLSDYAGTTLSLVDPVRDLSQVTCLLEETDLPIDELIKLS